MRYLEWGVYDSEWAEISGRKIDGKSRQVDGVAGSDVDNGGEVPSSWVELNNTYAETHRLFVKVGLSTIRSLIGYSPVLLAARWAMASFPNTQSAVNNLRFHAVRPASSPDYTDATCRYRDSSLGLTWYLDRRAPVPGHDVDLTPFATYPYSNKLGDAPTSPDHLVDVTGAFEEALSRGRDFEFLLWPEPTSLSGLIKFAWNYIATLRPRLRIYYLFPLEFFLAAPDGSCDLTRMVDTQLGDNPFQLGKLERNEVGTPVKGYVRNMSTRDFPLFDVLDDHPEWSDPVQRAGTGTGALDYVSLAGDAVSQKYTVVFSSSTEFEVKAEAYRDNVESLHPQINADPTWQGDTGTIFNAPEGGLTIPPEAWQPGTLVADELEVYVKGDTSDHSWPADSAAQMEMTADDGGGAPVAAGWRPFAGRRTTSRASVTISATTVKVPTRAVDPAQWPASTPAFIGDSDHLHEGTVVAAQEAEIGATSHAGGTQDDLTLSGNYNGVWEDDLYLEIDDAVSNPNTFKWSKDGGSTFVATGVACSLTPVILSDGIHAAFGAVTGHTLAESWTAPVQPFAVELQGLTADSTVYPAGARVSTGLPFQNLEAALWGTLTADAGPSETVKNRLYVHGPGPDYLAPTSAGFQVGDDVFVVDVADRSVNEYGTVSFVGATYLDLNANLETDFPEGALVTVKGSGEAPFWLRGVPSGSTLEGLKQARLNARA